MVRPIRVLCVDDHPAMRDGIAFALRSQTDMELVGQAVNGEEAVRLFGELRPDITLMDLQMPIMTGMAAIQRIRADFPRAKIIVLTTFTEDVHASRALKAGAAAYLLKGKLRTELINTIRAVHERSIAPS